MVFYFGIFLPFLSALVFREPAYMLIEIATLPIGIAAFFKSRKLFAEDLAETLSQSISGGITNYFNSPKFAEAMDDAFVSACASLAKEADDAGQAELARGYRILGNVKPEPKILGKVIVSSDGRIYWGSEDETINAIVWDSIPEARASGFNGTVKCQDPCLEVRCEPLGDGRPLYRFEVWQISGLEHA